MLFLAYVTVVHYAHHSPEHNLQTAYFSLSDYFVTLQVRLWNATSQSCIGVGTGHNGDILAVAFAKKSFSFFVSGSGYVLHK